MARRLLARQLTDQGLSSDRIIEKTTDLLLRSVVSNPGRIAVIGEFTPAAALAHLQTIEKNNEKRN